MPILGVNCVTQAEIDQHLTLGMNLLARGAYSDALSHFHAAVDADPNNYMSFYKRATVYLAMSRSRPALTDLDTVLKMKPDFVKARHQRGGVLLKMGRLDEAHIDLENVVRKEPENMEAQKQYAMVNSLKERDGNLIFLVWFRAVFSYYFCTYLSMPINSCS